MIGLLLATCSPAFAQGEPCAELGASLSNGRLYAKNTPYPVAVDPGLSISNGNTLNNADNWAERGVLVGNSMRLQPTPSGGPRPITYESSCVTNTVFSAEPWGGSGKQFWDTDTGVIGSVGDPNDLTSVFTCWEDPSDGSYDFYIGMTLTDTVTVDGIYFEQLFGPMDSGGMESFFAEYTISRQINGGIWEDIGKENTAAPDHKGIVFTPGNTTIGVPISYYHTPEGGTYAAGTVLLYQISLRTPQPYDPILGDFAILGCCAVIPEPSSLMLGSLASILLLVRRKR